MVSTLPDFVMTNDIYMPYLQCTMREYSQKDRDACYEDVCIECFLLMSQDLTDEDAVRA